MSYSRRDILRMGGGLAAAATVQPAAPRRKRVIVAGAGIAGLSCAWELQRRGHDVTVLEAADRTGGHVFTYRGDLDDGLYGDGGAEHFTRPGYDQYWSYVREFDLAVLPYPRRDRVLRRIRGSLYSPEQLVDRQVLAKLGFNAREAAYAGQHGWPEMAGLYFRPYLDAFQDEYEPFVAGADELDRMTVTALLHKQAASPAAIEFLGGDGSALHAVWHAAILARRGVPLWPTQIFRLKGGNQALTDTFTERLGDRVRKQSPVVAIEHGRDGVRVRCRREGGEHWEEADYLVSAMSAVALRSVQVTPAWPEGKRWAIHNVPYYFDTRVILQTRTPFWERDGVSPSIEFGDPALQHVWRSCDEVQSARAILLGTGTGAVSPDAALRAFKAHYPGRSAAVEKVRTVPWAIDPWASACETTSYPVGSMHKFWPALVEPCGRIFFAGAYADNLNWGMEAATRSVLRVAKAIDAA